MDTVDAIKEDYQKKHRKMRLENLVRLRDEVARMSRSQFAQEIGIPKSNLSSIESGDRDPSLFNILAYQKYFKEHHGLCVSSDFLLGFTDVIENESAGTSKSLGLHGKSIEMLRKINNSANPYYAYNSQSLDALNLLLETYYDNASKNNSDMINTIFINIWQYINSEQYTTTEGKRMICFQNANSHESAVSSVVSIDTSSGIFGRYQKDQILKQLDKIKKYIQNPKKE